MCIEFSTERLNDEYYECVKKIDRKESDLDYLLIHLLASSSVYAIYWLTNKKNSCCLSTSSH